MLNILVDTAEVGMNVETNFPLRFLQTIIFFGAILTSSINAREALKSGALIESLDQISGITHLSFNGPSALCLGRSKGLTTSIGTVNVLPLGAVRSSGTIIDKGPTITGTSK